MHSMVFGVSSSFPFGYRTCGLGVGLSLSPGAISVYYHEVRFYLRLPTQRSPLNVECIFVTSNGGKCP